MAETTSAPSLREWVLVPRVPTTEMRRAMAHACTLGWDIGDYTWEQGLAVAPTPPTTLTEAVAAARAEGVREGLERAASNLPVIECHIGRDILASLYEAADKLPISSMLSVVTGAIQEIQALRDDRPLAEGGFNV